MPSRIAEPEVRRQRALTLTITPDRARRLKTAARYLKENAEGLLAGRKPWTLERVLETLLDSEELPQWASECSVRTPQEQCAVEAARQRHASERAKRDAKEQALRAAALALERDRYVPKALALVERLPLDRRWLFLSLAACRADVVLGVANLQREFTAQTGVTCVVCDAHWSPWDAEEVGRREDLRGTIPWWLCPKGCNRHRERAVLALAKNPAERAALEPRPPADAPRASAKKTRGGR